MPIHIIPVNKLSAHALKGVIEEFITRGGTDYGAVEASLDIPRRYAPGIISNPDKSRIG